jgi:toxin ParE1/3/4
VKPDIVWARSALADLAHIDEYYSRLDPEYANRTARGAVAAARFLLANPFAGPKVEGTAYRKWPVADTPYLLIYRPERGALRVVRVRHAREDWRPAP